MAQKVYGPIRGAGVQLVEQEGQKPIEPGALGWAGYAGILERGPVGELIVVPSSSRLEKKVGRRIADSLLPDACQTYFDVGAGAGGLLLARVTDGNERQAQGYRTYDGTQNVANLLCRKPSRTVLGTLLAKNGGRWGGAEKRYTEEFSLVGDLTETTLDTGKAIFTTDEWKGGYIELNAVANTRYPIVGSTAAGVLTVEADQTMASDLAASGTPTDFRYYLVLDRDSDKLLSYEVRDGEENPTTEFALFVYVNGALVNKWPNLSIDPTSARYFVNVINNDDNNDEIAVTDTFSGARTADVRPASFFGTIDTVTTTTLDAVLHEFTINSPGGGDPTFALGTTDDNMVEQIITVTMTSPTAGDAVSDRFGALGTVTLGSLFTPNSPNGNKWAPPFTITAGGSPLAASDTLVIVYKPLVADELIGGYLFPDKTNARLSRFRITDNNHKTITVVSGSDLTADGAPADQWMAEAPKALGDGRDGVADLVDADYILQAWDVDTSPFNQTFDKGYGLVKFATPGVTATAVQKAGVAYAAAKNHQYRYEVPSATVTEASVDAYVNDTLGRSDYAVVSFPSYGYMADPDASASGKLKLVPLVGMIHGREARIASDYLGYHKAEAGVEARLPAVLKLPTGDTVLNEELLNPRGINVIKKKKGSFVLWGDRTLATDPTWRFKHHREQLSYYEHVLQEAFDWIVFGINDAAGRVMVKTSLVSFFLPEYNKSALNTDATFDKAATIKIDSENNPPSVKATGDMVTEISLQLADVVERLRIFVSRAGIFEAAG